MKLNVLPKKLYDPYLFLSILNTMAIHAATKYTTIKVYVEPEFKSELWFL